MTSSSATPRSRRTVLTGAIAGAAALAASRLAAPGAVSAHDADDLALNADNPTSALTVISQQTAGMGAFGAVTSDGPALQGVTGTGIGVLATTMGAGKAAVVGLSGDYSISAYTDAGAALDSGVYGFANLDGNASGVWGESGDTGFCGVFGSGLYGVEGVGAVGGAFFGDAVGVVGGSTTGTGIAAHYGSAPRPTPAPAALFASVTSNTQVGLEARGRIRFPSRSGHAVIKSGTSSITVSLAGVTISNFAIATLATYRSGRYVAAATCTAGKLTIRLNGTLSTATYVNYLVLG